MNDVSQLKILYEYYDEFNGGDSIKTKEAVNALIKLIPSEKTKDVEGLITTMGASIREDAYKAGFKAAVKLMSEVVQLK